MSIDTGVLIISPCETHVHPAGGGQSLGLSFALVKVQGTH